MNLAALQAFININLPDNNAQLITAAVMRSVCNAMLTLDHNDVASKQGGQPGEYYHLTLAQYNSVVNLPNNFVKKTGDTMTAAANLTFLNGEVRGLPNTPGFGHSATSRTYVDTRDALKVDWAGGAMDAGADLFFSAGGEVRGLPAVPGSLSAATSKQYVDGLKAELDADITDILADIADIISDLNDVDNAKVAKAGDTMNNNAILNFSNGIDTLVINSILNEIIFNNPASANGYAVLTDYVLHFEKDGTSEVADFNQFGLQAQNGSWAGEFSSDHITFTDLINAKEHNIDALNAAIRVSSSLAGFKGLQYAVDLSANFETLSIPHVGWVQNYVQNVNNLNNYVPKSGSTNMALNADLTFFKLGATAKIEGNKITFDNVESTTILSPEGLSIGNKGVPGNSWLVMDLGDAIVQSWSMDDKIGIIQFLSDRIDIFLDNALFKGLQYNGDYSANFTARSLPDVGWVQDYVENVNNLANYVKKAGDTMDDAVSLNFPHAGLSKKININGTTQEVYLSDNTDDVFLKLQNDLLTIEKTGVNATVDINTAKSTLDITSSSFWGIGIVGTGKRLAIGDWFNDTTPYMYMGENGGTDTDAWEFYGQKGFFLRTGSVASTALIRGTQLGKVGIKNESPVYDFDVTGDLNITGNFYKGGTIGYLASAWGAVTNPGLVLANLRVRTLVINGVSVNVVVNP